MSIELILFHVVFIFFMVVCLKFKEFKRSLSIFLIILITIFYSPIVYYVYLEGAAYRIFDNASLSRFILVASAVFLQMALLLVIKNGIRIKKNKLNIYDTNKSMLMFYMIFIIGGVGFYLALHFTKLPIYTSIMTGAAAIRPDTIGYLPNYFTFSAISNFVLPGFYFYYKDVLKERKVINILALVLISILLISGGNKGFLAYFYLFIWINEYKMKINLKIVMMFGFLLSAYVLFQLGEIRITQQTIEYLTSSPFRRFFVSQGSGFIARIHLLESGIDFNNIDLIKSYIHESIYGIGSGGTSPTYFLGDLVIKYGYIGGATFHLIVITILVYTSKVIDTNYRNDVFIKWNFFIILYLLGMAELSRSFFLRFSVIVINILMFYIISKLKRRQKKTQQFGRNNSKLLEEIK